MSDWQSNRVRSHLTPTVSTGMMECCLTKHFFNASVAIEFFYS